LRQTVEAVSAIEQNDGVSIDPVSLDKIRPLILKSVNSLPKERPETSRTASGRSPPKKARIDV
jgi:hypothetical protein